MENSNYSSSACSEPQYLVKPPVQHLSQSPDVTNTFVFDLRSLRLSGEHLQIFYFKCVPCTQHPEMLSNILTRNETSPLPNYHHPLPPGTGVNVLPININLRLPNQEERVVKITNFLICYNTNVCITRRRGLADEKSQKVS